MSSHKRLSNGCWVGKHNGVLLICVCGQYYAVEDRASVAAVEKVLAAGEPYEDGPSTELLTNIGLMEASSRDVTVPDTYLAIAVHEELAVRGLQCQMANIPRGTDDGQSGPSDAVIHFTTSPISPSDAIAAAGEAARLNIPLVTVMRDGNDLAVTSGLYEDQRGCVHCLWLRHAATLPRTASATLAPGHRVLAESLKVWPLNLIDVLATRLADAITSVLHGRTRPVLRLHADTLSFSRHFFLARPDCPVCGTRTGPVSVPLDGDPAEDPWCGLVTSISEGPPVADELFSQIAAGSLQLDFTGVPIAYRSDLARGLGFDLATARDRARGEALERYAARSPQFQHARLNLPPHAEVLTLHDLWPSPPVDDATPSSGSSLSADIGNHFRWIRATWLHGGPVWVPWNAMIIGGTLSDHPIQVTSNGVAAGASLEESRQRAVAELIERDAVLSTWVQRRPATKLQITDPRMAAIMIALGRLGVNVSLWRLKSVPAAVPVVLAVGRSDGRENLAIILGAACDRTVGRAAVRAICELAGNAFSTAEEIRHDALQSVAKHAVRSIDDHAAYYLGAPTNSAFDFLGRTEEPTVSDVVPEDPSDVPVDIEKECVAVGLRIASCEITPADVAACGVHVVRAVSPDLVPLWFGWNREPIGHPRLRCANPNREPHPFR